MTTTIIIAALVATLVVWAYNEIKNAPLMPDDYDQDITPRREIATDAEMRPCREGSDYDSNGRPAPREAECPCRD